MRSPLVLIDTTTDPITLFGADPIEAKRIYRRLAREAHPDSPHGDGPIFAKLSRLWDEYNGKTVEYFTMSTKKRSYVVSGGVMTEGDTAKLYQGVYLDGASGDEVQCVLKMPRLAKDNDLMEAEARALRTLITGEEQYRPFVPKLIESFRHRSKVGKIERRINVMNHLNGFYTLTEVMDAHSQLSVLSPNGTRKTYQGLDPRDVAWIWRRALIAIAFAHDNDIVHGAVFPEHILIHPQKHGLVLVDWCYSVERGTPIHAIVERYRGRYPVEVLNSAPATEATDIHMLSETMLRLGGIQTPRQIRAFVRGCTLSSELQRPHNAWKLLAEYEELIERLWGPKKFRPFVMPTTD
jgi:serine/threonine protein kinase